MAEELTVPHLVPCRLGMLRTLCRCCFVDTEGGVGVWDSGFTGLSSVVFSDPVRNLPHLSSLFWYVLDLKGK